MARPFLPTAKNRGREKAEQLVFIYYRSKSKSQSCHVGNGDDNDQDRFVTVK